MGNVEMHDLAPVHKDERKELDLSYHVDYKKYCQHVNGEFSDCCLKELPWSIRDSISLYEKINVSFNCLTSLPAELPFRLPHLSYVNLSYNQIASLPESTGLLFHLQELLLGHNCLTKLPSSFKHLPKLEKVDLSHNELEELPDDIGCMKSLKKINVSHNKLKHLPASLGLSETLEVLLATANCCGHHPPQDICDKGSEETLKFLRKCALAKDTLIQQNDKNFFPRVRGNIVQTSVLNPHSARTQYVQIQTDTANTASRIRTPLLPPLSATNLNSDELKDRLVGVIYGAVIGDTLGKSTEFLTPDECKFHYEEDSLSYESIISDEHRVHWKKREWTSNSDQAFLVLESLLQWAGVVDELEFAKRLITWKKNGIPDLDLKERYVYSNVISLVLQEDNYVENPHYVAKCIHQKGVTVASNGIGRSESTVSASCLTDSGALPRAVMLGIPHFHDLEEVISNSVRICLATHHDERCLAACVTLSVVIAIMLQGKGCLDSLSYVNELLNIAEVYGAAYISDNTYKEEFKKVCQYQSFGSIGISEPSVICQTFKPVACAFAALRQMKNFRQSLSSLLMWGGHSSMNGCIAGAMLGCKFGYSNLPKDWLEGLNLKHKEWLNIKINALLDMMGLP